MMNKKPLAILFAHRINNRPMAIAADFLPAVEGLLDKADDFVALSKEMRQSMYEETKLQMLAAYGLVDAMDKKAIALESSGSSQRKQFAFGNGTAVIPIHGTLVNRCNDTACGTMTGYNMIQNALSAAVADNDVERILFDVDSGGGEAAGCPETAQMIRDAGAIKPTMAFIDSSCYSAAYWLASAANKVVSLSSGGVGSIGAIAVHTDYSEALSDNGIKVTYIRAGNDKAKGGPYEPLDADTTKRIQSAVDKCREQFAQNVADNRGLSLKEVMGTEANVYDADVGLEMGLVDALSDPIHALSLFDTEPRKDSIGGAKASSEDIAGVSASASISTEHKPKGEDMPQENQGAQQQPINAAVQQPQDSAKIAADAASAERTRIAAIIESEESEGRETLAKHFAFKTAMAPEDAIAAMAASPKAVAEATKSVNATDDSAANNANTAEAAFNNAMEKTGNPNIGAGAGDGVGISSEDADANAIIAAYEAATGNKLNV